MRKAKITIEEIGPDEFYMSAWVQWFWRVYLPHTTVIGGWKSSIDKELDWFKARYDCKIKIKK